MIKLSKTEEPQVLKSNAAAWLSTLVLRAEMGEVPTNSEKSRYRHADIKAALVIETAGKCAYCESFLRHVAYGDVEHIVPKSLDVAMTFDWSNLTLACDVCNTGKGDGLGVVDPYNDDPEAHFWFVGPMIMAKPDSEKGILTKTRLRLNRAELLQRRSERLAVIADRILLIHQTDNPAIKEALLQDLLANELADATEYAAFTRSLIATLKVDQVALVQ